MRNPSQTVAVGHVTWYFERTGRRGATWDRDGHYLPFEQITREPLAIRYDGNPEDVPRPVRDAIAAAFREAAR